MQVDQKRANALPYRPDVDEGNVSRDERGVGAFSHYHNFTFHAFQDIQLGGEVFISYPDEGGFYQERNDRIGKEESGGGGGTDGVEHVRDGSWLEENGLCLDNLRPG